YPPPLHDALPISGGTNMIGSLGNVPFEASYNKLRTFNNFTRSAAARWADHERQGKKPRAEFIGPDAESITFNIRLDLNHGIDPERELTGLRTARDEGRVLPLVLGGKFIGDYYIESLNESHRHYTGHGLLVVAGVDLSLREYSRV